MQFDKRHLGMRGLLLASFARFYWACLLSLILSATAICPRAEPCLVALTQKRRADKVSRRGERALK